MEITLSTRRASSFVTLTHNFRGEKINQIKFECKPNVTLSNNIKKKIRDTLFPSSFICNTFTIFYR